MFQPPLSPGLLWYNVYIYSKSDPYKIETNLTKKYVSEKYCHAKLGPEFLHSDTNFLRTRSLQQAAKTGPRTPQIGRWFWSSSKPQFCTLNSNLESLLQQFWNLTETIQFGFKQFSSVQNSLVRFYLLKFVFFFGFLYIFFNGTNNNSSVQFSYFEFIKQFSSVQFSSWTKPCPPLDVSSVNWSFGLNKRFEIEQHINERTHKLNDLKF